MENVDKIFVRTDPFGILHAYDKDNHPDEGEEFIRKGAIVDWMNGCIDVIDEFDNPDSYSAKGAKAVILDFMEMLEKL